MKGEKLTGKGTRAGEADEEEEEDSSSYKDLDLEKINKEMNIFATKVVDVAKNATVSANSKMLQRDFMVCVKTVKYDLAEKIIKTKYENINVLVGPKS